MPRFFASLGALLVAGTLGGLAPNAGAVVPLKPSNIRVDVTKAIDADLATQAGVDYDDYDSYLIRWADNSFDEEGFRVEVRVGNAGSFTILSYQSANSTSYVARAQLPRFPKDTLLQFQVTAYKFNGANVEYSYGPIFPYTTVDGSTTFTAPTGLTAENVNDGTVNLKWTDNSGAEVYHQLFYKKQADATFTSLGFTQFNFTEVPMQLGLVPGGSYDFQVRATLKAPTDGVTFGDIKYVTNPTNTANITIPALAAPTGLIGSVSSETSVKLSWADNSRNETAYQIEYRQLSDTGFTVLGTVSANTTTVTVPTPPATTVEWQVRAIYKTTEVTTAIESAATTPTVQLSTAFPGPSDLTATTSAKAGAVDLTWNDNSTSESGFDILSRPTSGGDFTVALSVPAGTTTATVTSRLDATGTATIPLALDTNHEFVVRAYYGSVYSAASNSATADAKDGFTSRFYHPATVGLAYTTAPLVPTANPTPANDFPLSTQYQLTVSSAVTTTGSVKNWNITGLSTVGLTFDNETGIITGTPTIPGVFTFPMTATFTSGWVANGTLTLRIMRPRATPTSQAIADTTIAPNATFTIPLAAKFSDPESEKAVRFETSKGNIDILLYPSLAPQAVANFLAYVNAGDYDGVVFHRSIPGFVIQGGAFKPVATPKSYSAVTPRTSPINEPGISNVTGTISAAKLGNNPNSATHDFFLNLEDNNTTDLNSLDHQNGGFTAFGRVVTPAEDLNQPLATVYPVLSTIAALPRGNYIDNNTTATYDATLDKRILVDGSAGGFSDWPMDVTGAAPADMDVTKNVFIDRAREIAVLNYSILTNTAPNVASATIVGGELQLRGLTAGTTTITVKATDLDSQTTQQTFTVTVTANYKGPVITKQPMSLAVVAGAKATFTVTATGTALTYQWRKADVNGDFIAIDGATTKSLVINNVQAADTGSYDVLVTNATTTLTSSAARLDFKAAPAITTSPLSRLVNVGQPLVLDVAVTGAPAPAIAWLRGTATVAGQTKTKLNIPAAKLTDGGVYTARATNPSGKVTSNPANVYVVDPATVVTTIKAGAKVILKAGVTGPGLTYQWLKNGITMGADDDRVTGTNGPVLTFKTTAYSDSADYTCQATMLDGLGDVTTGIQRLAVVVRPVIANYTADTGVVGFNYDFTVPYDTSLTNTPTKFSLAALPPGLTYDSKTGRITGRPIKAGRYFVSTIISNVVGNSNTAVGTLDILPMSQYGVGTFLGAVEPSALNGNKGGRLDLTTLDSGTYTGKLVLGADSYPIAGKLTYFPGALAPQAQIIVTRKGKTPVLLSFAVDEADGDLSGQVTDGTSVSELIGFRQFWHSNWNPSSFFAGNYNMAINLKAADVGNAAVPQGSGYATMLVTGGGSVITTVKLPDGVAVTMSSIIGPRGQLMMYQMLYKNTGSMLGTPSLATTNLNPNGQSILRVAGAFRWIKDAQTTATERSYKAGFALDMDVLGRTYRAPTAVQPPLTNTRIMELPAVSNNAKIDFSQGGLAAATINPDVTVTVPLNNVIQPPVAGTAENPAKVKASLNPASGLYTGSFELVDPPGTTKRTVTFQGLLIPTIPITPAIAAEDTADNVAIPAIPGSDPQAAGYFLLNQLGSAGPPVTTTANSPILSGKVELKPTDITITSVTPDPLSDTVNPGTAYSFTVVAAGQGTLTYQWRRDGANLSGQTGAILNIPTVTEANQGSYTVVVSNGSTSVTSTPLTLNVNDPITSIGITRSPTGSTVATGQAVTFTATPNGVGPFTYQWFKDAPNNPISGATLDHYDIASANAAEHNGSYGVTVIGPVNPAGVDSGTVSLTVIDPVSSVTASRSPNDTPIAAGQPVTFTASAAGGGTFQYQWSKGGVAIPTATSVTYTIDPVAVADTGDYSVLVTNEVTPAGVASAAVNLTITDMVLNAVATRSPNGIVAVGSTVTFSVTAQGNGLTYQWRRNGSDIPGATNSTYDLVATTDDSDITFDVLVKNDATPAGLASNGLAITVAVPISGVGISQDPSGPVQAGEGNSVTFTATVTAGSDPLYQWWKGTTAIPTATGSTYTITNIAIADGGDYHVVVSNAVSSADSATLTLSVTP